MYFAGTRLATVAADGSVCYYHNNHLETPVSMTDGSGNVVWKADYRPFGKAEVASSSTVVNDFRFPGQVFDAETGYHYNWNRYYDSETGRYLTGDPIGIQRGTNHLYVYVGGNPINSIDPDGKIIWSGTAYQVSASELIGGTFAKFSLESECIDGKKAKISVWATGPTVSLGARFSATTSSVSFEDYSSTINPSGFNGIFMAAQAGVTFHPGVPIRPPGQSIPPGTGPGVGLGVSDIRLGNAFTTSPISIGLSYGFDRSISGTIGSSTVMDIEYSDCCP